MARRFRFRLEVVRKLREQVRDAQRRALADAVRAVTQAEQRIEHLTEQLGDMVSDTRTTQRSDRLDLATLRGQQFYQGWLHRRIMESNAQLMESRSVLERERDKLGDATGQLKAIEKLRERRLARHQWEDRREEQASLDEAALRTLVREPRWTASGGRT
jgi:flagellar export protein FliJ